MLFLKLLAHKFKESTRSNFWQKQLALNIVIGFLLLILFLYLLALGLFIDVVLLEKFPDEDPVALFNGVILYYFGVELMMRFMMQNIPTVNIESYLHLPIKKTSIIHYLNVRSLFVVGNYLPLLVFIPFAIKVIAPAYGGFIAFVWVITLFIMSFTNSFIALYIKRQLTSKPIITGIAGLTLIGLILLDYFKIVSFAAVSRFVFNGLLSNPVFILLFIVLLIGAYLLNFYFLKSKLYPEELTNKTQIAADSSRAFQYLKQYGHTGQLIINDLKLIWRHKRTRSIVYMTPIFLGYGLLFYTNKVYIETNGFLIFVGIFMIGGMMLNYLNYAFSYESGHFDFILANYKDLDRYLTQKFMVGVAISTISYILTIPYVYFGFKILFINSMAYLYNIGILSFLLLYTATYSKKRMDLSKGAAFNYQGMGAGHWLSMIPFFLLPLLIYWPFAALGYPMGGFIVIGGMGFMGLVLYKPLMNIIKKQFQKKKYEMANGFRSDF